MMAVEVLVGIVCFHHLVMDMDNAFLAHQAKLRMPVGHAVDL